MLRVWVVARTRVLWLGHRRREFVSGDSWLLSEGTRSWMERTFYDLLICPCPHMGQKVRSLHVVAIKPGGKIPFRGRGAPCCAPVILPNTLSCMAKVLIILGSKSDMEFAETCAKQLDELGIRSVIEVSSAHR